MVRPIEWTSARSRLVSPRVSSEKPNSCNLSEDEYSMRSSGLCDDRPVQSALNALTGVPAKPTRIAVHLRSVSFQPPLGSAS